MPEKKPVCTVDQFILIVTFTLKVFIVYLYLYLAALQSQSITSLQKRGQKSQLLHEQWPKQANK